MATLANKGDLVCGATTCVEDTPDMRWVRTTVYNRDTVDHTFTLLLDGTPIKMRIVQPTKDFTFPLLAVARDIDVAVAVGGAKVTAEPTFAVSGTH